MLKPQIISQYIDYLGRKHPLFALEEARNPWLYTASVILSGNTTDAAVNAIMPAFQQRFPTPTSILEDGITRETIIPYLKGINHNGSKSEYLQNAARHILENGGDVAKDIDQLTKVKGIGRKSAAIILHRLHGLDQGFPLDTHCLRVLSRLGWYTQKRPESLEKALLRDFPEGTRHDSHLILTHHGREICHPQQPKCHQCRLVTSCNYPKTA